MIHYAINIARCSVRMYVNNTMIRSRSFTSRKMRNEWMKEWVLKMKGVKNIYFEVLYREVAKKERDYTKEREYQKTYRANKLKAVA